MFLRELKELLADMPDYYEVDVFSVELGNGRVIIQGDGFRGPCSEEVECPECGHEFDAPVVFKMEPRPKAPPLTPKQEEEAAGKLHELNTKLREIDRISAQLMQIKHELNKAWRPE